ncbi:hypothetical protein ABPG77_004638 [Micractinium sp. CCAP 211/92]
MQLKIKQVTGDSTFSVESEPESTVLELKQAVADKLGDGLNPESVRLIYRGQILKDPQSLASYGLQEDHVVHMVKSKQPQRQQEQGGNRPTGASSSSSRDNPLPGTAADGRGAAPPGVDPLASAMGGLGLGGAGVGSQADMMQQMLQSPMTQALLRNPELLRTMMQANPAVRQMMESNPELGRMLTDPDMLRQMTQVMSNPALMREQMRNMDRALSNIESMPGGFNALRQFHSTLQPLDEAAREGPEAGAENPFAELFQPAGSGGAGSAAQQPAGAPNEAPLPNPWAAVGGGASAGGAAGGGSAAGLGGLSGLGGMGGMPGLDPAQMQQLMSDPGMQEAMQAMMADPAMQQLMQQQMSAMLATPEGQAQMQAMLEQNPMYQSAVAANPQLADQMRAMLTDPQRLRAMMDPRAQHAMQQMMQAMQELQSTGLFPEMPMGLGPLPGGGASGGAGAGGGAGAPGAGLDFGALMGMLGGGAGGMGGFGAPPPPANPEQAYAAQLQQLQDMGFYDRDANLRALVASGGNVNVAVERLLSSI